MDKKLLEFFEKALEAQEERDLLTDIVVDTVSRADAKAVRPLIARVKQIVKATGVSPTEKLKAFQIFVKCMKLGNPGFLLETENKFLGRLSILAQHLRSSHDIERGATLFGQWSQMEQEAEASIRFFRLLLLSVKEWGERYIYIKPNAISKYAKTLQKLLSLGVTFPSGEDISELKSTIEALIKSLEDGQGSQAKIVEYMQKLPEVQSRLKAASESSLDSGSQELLKTCFQLISTAEALYKQREVAQITDKVQQAVDIASFPAIIEPLPIPFSEQFDEDNIALESEEDDDDLERSEWDLDIDSAEAQKDAKSQVLDLELKLVELTAVCNKYKDELRKMEVKNRNLEVSVEALRQELASERSRSADFSSAKFVPRSSVASVSRPSMEAAAPQYPIANTSSYQLLSSIDKGTLYVDQYCEVLFNIRLEENPMECNGRFMLVLRSSLREILETAKLENVSTPGFNCKAAKSIERSELLQQQHSTAQYRFRYTEITAVAPVFELSFVTGGLQFMYYFKLPVSMMRFGKAVAGDLQTVNSLWSELSTYTNDLQLPSFDPLILNTSQLADRIRLSPHIAVYSGAPLPAGCVQAATSILGETVLFRLTVTSQRTVKIEVAAKSAKVRAMAISTIAQVVEG